MLKNAIVIFAAALSAVSLSSQCVSMAKTATKAAKPGLLSQAELKQLVPTNVFFQGQTAPTQLRNSAGIRTASGKLVLAFLVDTSGYASEVAQKYQGYLLTETTLDFGQGVSLAPGAYGSGFLSNDHFNVMDLGGKDVVTVSAKSDSDLKRPVPLHIASAGGESYRLYFGRRYVEFKPE
jgi:hypothetical protein